MGQVQSDDLPGSDEQVQDTGECEIDSTNQNEPAAGIPSRGDKSTGVKIDQDISKCSTTRQLSGSSKKLTASDRQQQQQRNFELQQQQQRARKMSNVSQSRNIQLLSMRPRTERDSYADELKSRRRSSLINLILGAPSSGPRFCDDLCSINSRLSNFGIEFFPEAAAAYYPMGGSSYLMGSASRTSFAPSLASTWRLEDAIQRPSEGPKSAAESLEQVLRAAATAAAVAAVAANSSIEQTDMSNQGHRRRRSSIGSIAEHQEQQSCKLATSFEAPDKLRAGHMSCSASNTAPSGKLAKSVTNEPSGGLEGLAVNQVDQKKHLTYLRKPSLASTLASIDLTSSFEQADRYLQANFTTTDASGCGTVAEKDRPFSYGSSSKQHQLRQLQQQQQKQQQLAANGDMIINGGDFSSRIARGRINQSGRVLRRSGSELSLYSTSSGLSRDANGCPRASVGSSSSLSTSLPTKKAAASNNTGQNRTIDPMKETKLIIILQVCLPFILAGFGNMSAGLALGKISQWEAFVKVPAFIVLLPPLVGLKGNIEMTLASRLSTLSNLNLLDTKYRRQRAYISNLILIVSQAMGLSVFAAFVAIVCELSLGVGGAHAINGTSLAKSPEPTAGDTKIGEDQLAIHVLLVLASALATTVILSMVSSVVMSLSVLFANWIRVNPDNLSTLVAALYGDVSCVLIYGFISNWIFLAFKEQSQLFWPLGIVITVLMAWPPLLFASYKLKETHSIALASMPPMLCSILISMGSGVVLSLAVSRFKLMALYQPVVNGFSANLIAVQASRVSTWLWCDALDSLAKTNELDEGKGHLDLAPKKAIGSLASFVEPPGLQTDEPKQATSRMQTAYNYSKHLIKTLLWSFLNDSPNSIAAKLLLLMLIPAHTIYFLVLWLVLPAGYIVLTWQFYLVYLSICIFQGFILLTICQPLMTLLMNYHFDPDIFGISILMALADLTGTLCLTGAFFALAGLSDVNAA